MRRPHQILVMVALVASTMVSLAALAEAPPPPPPAPAATEATEATEDTGAAIFQTRCSGCHTIGGGAMKGPDLQGATVWPAAQLRPAVARMEKYVGPLGGDELDALVSLLRDPGLRARLEAEQQRAAAAIAATLDAPSVELGERLFYGHEALSGGGLACSSCHSVGGLGGTLGPALDEVATRTQGLALLSAIEQSKFPVMEPAYRTHPVTRQEALHLAAWLEARAAQPTPTDALADDRALVVSLAAGLAALFIAALALATRSRVAGTRQRLVEQALRR